MRPVRWHTDPLPFDTVRKLSQALGTSEILAAALARRGYTEPEAASAFLSPRGELHDPFLFPAMSDVCARIRRAVTSGEKVCVHGDYDVDGITSTALLTSVLREMGAKVIPRLPNRFRDGYGVNTSTLEAIAAEGTTLLITVDCGINARQQLARATELGMESIVIDHHLPVKGQIPEALIVAPLLCDYPFKELSGVGLAFKVAQGLIGEQGQTGPADNLPPQLQALLDLVALGTIADVVPLLDENRSLVKRGLIQLSRTLRPGLRELMRIGQVEPSRVNAGLVAFRLAPRINAAGRLDDPKPALDLLLAEDEAEAAKLAGSLDSFNRERQQIENRMLAEAEEMINGWPDRQKEQLGYVLCSPGWHEGVMGIVASRLVDLHQRPVIVIAEDEEAGRGKGSGRSVRGFDLHRSLLGLGHLLEAFGGHSAACGLTIDTARVQEFREGFSAVADSVLSGQELRPSHYVDALVSGHELTLELAEELSQMEPFGLGNPSVDLLAAGAYIRNGRTTRDGRHLQCLVEAGGARSTAIGFGQAFLLEKLSTDQQWDVVFRLERNEFNGSVAPQLNLREFFPRASAAEQVAGICEHQCDHDCPDRLTGGDFWALTNSAAGLFPLGFAEGDDQGTDTAGLADKLIDRRNRGDIQGQIAKMIACGQNLLLIVSDVARRRRLISADLPSAGSSLQRVALASSRCGDEVLSQRSRQALADGQTLAMVDFAVARQNPGLLAGFNHLIFIDPPPDERLLPAIAAAAPAAWIHLFYCADEVQFTGKVLEHEYDLRAPITKIYKQLKTEKTWPLDATTERLLLAGGKYLRQPMMIARSLRVLEELGLISVEGNLGPPMLTLLEAGKTSLDRSETYNQSRDYLEGCLKYLSKSLDVKVI